MLASQFTKASPGRLVPIVFEERANQNGKVEVVHRKGIAFVPDLLPPQFERPVLLEAIYTDLIAAERSLARLDGIGEDLANAHLLWAPLARREAILSSKIEDTIATAKELASAEAGERPPRGEITEVMNYVSALRFGLASELPISLRLIRGMHKELMVNRVRGSDMTPGEFRTNQNFIGNEEKGFSGARFVPPPAGEHLASGLNDLEVYANKKRYGIPKLVAVALMHYQFETLHPFPDGNGRIGRLISALSLCRMGLLREPFVYLSGYFEPRQANYNDLMLRVSTHGDWISWVKFFMAAIACQAKDAETRVRTMRKLRAEYREKLAAQNAPGRIMSVVDELFVHPVVTVEQVARRLDVSKPTARSYIHRLAKIGVLTEPPKTSYREYFMAGAIIALIDAPPITELPEPSE